MDFDEVKEKAKVCPLVSFSIERLKSKIKKRGRTTLNFNNFSKSGEKKTKNNI